MPTPDQPTDQAPAAAAPTARPQNIVLIGFMATGKTTLGRKLARKIGFKFIDCDHEIEKQQGFSIAEIFELHGEAHFRQLESAFLESLRTREKLVISTGGGAVGSEANRKIIPTLGYVVWLHAKKRAIFERVSRNNNRPLMRTDDPWKTLKALFGKRKPLYKATADIKIKTSSLTMDETVEGIIDTACYYFSQQPSQAGEIREKSNPT